MPTTEPITTAEQLLEAGGDIGRCELVRGELIMMTPAGSEHGAVAHLVGLLLGNHVREHQLGRVFAAETGFILQRTPDTVRASDVAFVRAERVQRKRRGFVDGAPDLAVEVLSPDDRAEAVAEKVEDWLGAGCRAVWVVNPRNRSVTIHHPDRTARVLAQHETLDGGDVLPGFTTPVAAVFE